MKLNIGCGMHKTEGWVNIDIHKCCDNPECTNGPDVVADARDLPYERASVDAIYCGHVLEHLPLDDVVPALQRMRKTLKPGAKIIIVGPDFDRATANFPEMALAIWPGDVTGWEGARHQWCATGANTLALVREVFPDANEIPITELDSFWPVVAFLEWQFAIEALA